MAVVYIGIGSNLGNRHSNCADALERLKEQGIRIHARSSMIETEPWGVNDQPRFINMAAEVETDYSPQELLGLLKKTEIEMGRKEAVHWGPRLIDLDILLYDDLVMDTPDLKIPHPNLHERDFVLRPFAEIAPYKEHPLLKKSVRDLLNELLTMCKIEKNG